MTGSAAEVVEKLKTGKLERSESLCNPGGGKGYGKGGFVAVKAQKSQVE